MHPLAKTRKPFADMVSHAFLCVGLPGATARRFDQSRNTPPSCSTISRLISGTLRRLDRADAGRMLETGSPDVASDAFGALRCCGCSCPFPRESCCCCCCCCFLCLLRFPIVPSGCWLVRWCTYVCVIFECCRGLRVIHLSGSGHAKRAPHRKNADCPSR